MGWVDQFRSWLGYGDAAAAAAGPATRQIVFSEVPQPVLPVDQLLMHFWSKTGKIGRSQALSVPAVRRGRNMICAISTLPLQAVDEDNRVVRRPLFAQLDSNTANVVVLAQSIEDLFFDAVAWWRVVGFDAQGYPSRIRRYDVTDVSLQPPDDYEVGLLPSGLPTEGVIWMGGEKVPFDQVIRFDSPNPGLLSHDPDVVRRAIALGQAAALYAATPRRRGYFVPADGVDPADDDAIKVMLDEWQKAAAERVDGYVPAAVKYEAIQDSTPAELQLVQMQQQVVLDLANMLGLDPEDLGANTTSRTYQNATDRRKDRVNDTLAPYMRAITDRLGMPDVTPEGERVRFGLDDYFQADPKTRAEVQQIYHALGATDAAEIREVEGKPPRTIRPPVPPAAAAENAAVLAPRRVPSSLGTEGS
jgi:hypothetical protein